MDWDKLKYFMQLSSRKLYKAGEVLNLSQSAISRQINLLNMN